MEAKGVRVHGGAGKQVAVVSSCNTSKAYRIGMLFGMLCRHIVYLLLLLLLLLLLQLHRMQRPACAALKRLNIAPQENLTLLLRQRSHGPALC